MWFALLAAIDAVHARGKRAAEREKQRERERERERERKGTGKKQEASAPFRVPVSFTQHGTGESAGSDGACGLRRDARKESGSRGAAEAD